MRWLHELNFHLRVPQAWPERQNEKDRKKFLEELRVLAAAPQVELWFWDYIARTPNELTDRLCTALKSFIDQPNKTASICSIRK